MFFHAVISEKITETTCNATDKQSDKHNKTYNSYLVSCTLLLGGVLNSLQVYLPQKRGFILCTASASLQKHSPPTPQNNNQPHRFLNLQQRLNLRIEIKVSKAASQTYHPRCTFCFEA